MRFPCGMSAPLECGRGFVKADLTTAACHYSADGDFASKYVASRHPPRCSGALGLCPRGCRPTTHASLYTPDISCSLSLTRAQRPRFWRSLKFKCTQDSISFHLIGNLSSPDGSDPRHIGYTARRPNMRSSDFSTTIIQLNGPILISRVVYGLTLR